MTTKTNYILERLRCDSHHVRELVAHTGQVGHPGVKGRFRELLLNNLLLPWLPPSVGCGTGLIVDCKQQVQGAGQDDIIVYDALLAPSILASPQSTHGVYLFDSALCRIEVKSKLTRRDLAAFISTSERVAELRMTARTGTEPLVFGALNMLVAFESEVAEGKELELLCEEMTKRGLDPGSGIVSAMCIADRGFWLLGEDNGCRRWKVLRYNDSGDPLAYFAGVVSNSCFDQRAIRQGLQPRGGGIGMYLDHPFEWADAP